MKESRIRVGDAALCADRCRCCLGLDTEGCPLDVAIIVIVTTLVAARFSGDESVVCAIERRPAPAVTPPIMDARASTPNIAIM